MNRRFPALMPAIILSLIICLFFCAATFANGEEPSGQAETAFADGFSIAGTHYPIDAEEIDLSGQNQELRGHVLGRICLVADQGRGTADRSSLQDKLRSLKIPEADGRVVRHENSPVRR